MLRNAPNAIANQIIHLHQTTTPADKMTLSATFGTLWAISNLQGCGSVAPSIELVCALLTAGAAVNQFGLQNTQALLTNTFNSFFSGGRKLGNAKPEVKAEVKAEEKTGYVTPEEHNEENTDSLKKTL